jgi:hypothetical protein
MALGTSCRWFVYKRCTLFLRSPRSLSRKHRRAFQFHHDAVYHPVRMGSASSYLPLATEKQVTIYGTTFPGISHHTGRGRGNSGENITNLETLNVLMLESTRMKIYHGGFCAIEKPEIRISANAKDFGQGFYCTALQAQAERWASRYPASVISVYEYVVQGLNVLEFDTMTDEWLDFIVECRSGKPHGYDVVAGAMANDQVWNYIADYIAGIYTREQFWVLAKFKYPTHQMAFCTVRALGCLSYFESYEVKK